ncbi:MAG: hypothetical protein SPL71_10550 [Oribacterium sp.]|nr:hypothetical protein [Oribacterium sp.]
MKAILGNSEGYTTFSFGDTIVRFKAPYSLEYYDHVIKWKRGYLVVDAKYAHNQENEEEYIDLVPIFNGLYIPETLLNDIDEVEVESHAESTGNS